MKTRTIVIIVLCVVLLVPALIGIAMVSLGVFMYNSASRDVMDGTVEVVDSNAVQIFNNQFLQYEGENRGSVVIQLIYKVNSSNKIYIEEVEIKYNEEIYKTELEIESLIDLINRTEKYDVKVEEYNKQGLISVISIKEI